MSSASEPLLPKANVCFDPEALQPTLSSRLIIEFIGTFFLVLTVYLTVAQEQQEAGLAIGTVLAVMIFMGGHISGAHYNPAVTFAVALSGRNHSVKFVVPEKDANGEDIPVGAKKIVMYAAAYIGAQVFGGIIAAAIGFGLTGVQWGPAPGAKFGIGQAFGAEVFYTFALALIVLNVATSQAAAQNHYYGFAIGFLVFVGATSVGDISGAVFNPAVGTGITLMDVFLAGSMKHIWLYWLAPFTGAGLAAGVFRLQNPAEYKSDKSY